MVIVGRCETELCVLLSSPNMSVSESHPGRPASTAGSLRLCECWCLFLASLSEIGTSQCGLSYWLLCALALLWSGESTEMKTGTVRGHMHTKHTHLILAVSVPHPDMAAMGLENSV